MSHRNDEWPLRKLLDCISDINSGCWEEGWREFVKRYKEFLYNKIKYGCWSWNVPRIRAQFSDTVNDIFSSVIEQLLENECKALRDFLERDNEKSFNYWLAKICNRCTSSWIKKHIIEVLVNEEILDFIVEIKDIDFDKRWELYESIVTILRESSKRERKYLERDIHIFLLHVWCEFSDSMVLSLPHMKDIGPRVVDVVTYRIREILENAREEFLN